MLVMNTAGAAQYCISSRIERAKRFKYRVCYVTLQRAERLARMLYWQARKRTYHAPLIG